THAETESGEVDFSAGDEFDKVVVASATGDGAEFAFDIEGFEDDAGVVSEPADNVVIDTNKILEAAGGKIVENGFEFGGGFGFCDEGFDLVCGKTEGAEFFFGFERFFTFDFIDDLKEFVSAV